MSQTQFNDVQGQEQLPRGIFNDITETIGNTPMVHLQRLERQQGCHARLLGKVEYFNPAGSIKDRPAMAMIEALMASPQFSEKTEIVEATSGNNGVACAWICALKNIPITIVIPEHMSVERRKLMKLYGATVVTTPKELGTKGAIDKAKSMLASRPHAVMLDQFANHANPDMHGKTTAEEIWRDCNGQIDILVAGVGTGGTLTGIARTLKARNPNLHVVAVEPASCPVLSEGKSGVHNIQGLSSGHIPDILDVSLIDEIITVSDDEAVEHARLLARTEGLPVGISSGAAAFAAIRTGSKLCHRNKTIVTILADTAERYFSTALFAHCE